MATVSKDYLHSLRVWVIGESATAKRHCEEFLKLTAPTRQYRGGLVTKIRNKVAKQVLPLAAHTWFWQRAMRWIKEFGNFAVTLLQDEVDSGCRASVGATDIKGLLQDEEMLEVFVASLTLQDVGFSVPRAARRFLSAARMRLGWKSLNDNKSLTEIIRGFERSRPRTVIQAEALEVFDVERVASTYGCSSCWWHIQVACMVTLCFVAILRLGELVCLLVEDVTIVFKNGKEVSASNLSRIPRLGDVKGVFLHLRWRKANQSHSVHVPVACKTAITLLLRHLCQLRKVGRTTGPLFPSRQGRVSPTMNPSNSVSTSSVRDALRKALRDVCGLSMEQARLYSGHSMRVGGSNYIRRLGVSDEVHRLLGGWASLSSSRGYFQLLATEQFAMSHKFALKGRAPPVVEGARVASLQAVQLVSMTG